MIRALGHRRTPFALFDSQPTVDDHPRFGAHRGAAQPASATLVQHAPAVMDQGAGAHATSACEGHGWSTAIATYCAAHGDPLPFVPSPTGIYTVARCVERAAFPEGPAEPLGDNGTDSHAVIRGLRDYGVRAMRAPTRDGRYSDADPATICAEPSLTDLEAADRTRFVGAYRIAGTQAERVELVRACIAARIPVVIESFVDSAYMDLGPGVIADVPDEHDRHGGGHCETILAYRTRTDGATEFLVRGSWGTSWATEGSVWSSEARIAHAWALYAVDVRRAA